MVERLAPKPHNLGTTGPEWREVTLFHLTVIRFALRVEFNCKIPAWPDVCLG